MARPIASIWISNIKDPKEREEFERFLRYNVVVDRLIEILSEKERAVDAQETNTTDYDSASWAYKQADRNGYRRCLKQIQELFNYKKE